MTCKEIIEFLMAYLDGEADPRARAEFDRHLSECPACVNYLRTYQASIRAAKLAMCSPEAATGDEAPPPPEALKRAVMAAVRKARG